MGGSVTYGPLAFNKYTNRFRVSIVANIGQKDWTAENQKFLDERFSGKGIRLVDVSRDQAGSAMMATTAYRLVYDEQNIRTLSLVNKGLPIVPDQLEPLLLSSSRNIGAIFFVPVAAEFDESLVVKVGEMLEKKGKADAAIFAMDAQGLIRDFRGSAVITRDAESMKKKLALCARYLSFLKAEYSEALAILASASDPKPSPSDCAVRLQREFSIPIVAVTLGPGGCFVAMRGEPHYVPAFKPERVEDETGSGDVFLACTIAEMLCSTEKKEGPDFPCERHVLEAVKCGSAATSFRIEQRGPSSFQDRSTVKDRVANGENIRIDSFSSSTNYANLE